MPPFSAPLASGAARAIRGRFAPAPTGDLHLGSASTAMLAWLLARASGGEFVLRVEDLDAPRRVAHAEARQLDDLRWLGLDWDQGPDVGGAIGPFRQSERRAGYERAIQTLVDRDLVYLCDCSRAEVRLAATAPHSGDEGPAYPGTCREHGMRSRPWKRAPALRLRVPPGPVEIEDRFLGKLVQDVASSVGDFVLRRGDGVPAYQLAVVVDDLAMGITEVVRGADLLASTPRQVVLARLLGAPPPAWAHVPLVLAPDGERLAKRAGSFTVREHRAAGRAPGDVLSGLARMLGLIDSTDRRPIRSRELLERFDASALRGRASCRLTPDLAIRNSSPGTP